MEFIKVGLVVSSLMYNCGGVSLREQLEHIANARAVNNRENNEMSSRRAGFYQFDPREVSDIVGVPSMPSHLPEAEPILPGHTLLHPSLGMLKSAVKFPHRDLEDGAGVYGNINNLGIRYDTKNERVLYSGFRRSPTDIMYFDNARNTKWASKGVLRNQRDVLLSSSEEKFAEENTKKRTSEETITERNWIKSQKNFNHLEVNDNAPEYVDFIPKDTEEKIREWWFYSQNDFKEFSGERIL